ncbi:hypothetical protein T02_16219 [Trichinella nativa]|uniref:Uncharacterized protein n=1 Tax=Trichinella nativa TaxID=6335 RepID=A0A0V1L7D0_9BILA|nr:hypothetical protein T02_16219 [Trichinella nativa]
MRHFPSTVIKIETRKKRSTNQYYCINVDELAIGLSLLHSTAVNVCFGLLNILLLKLRNKCKSITMRCMQLQSRLLRPLYSLVN